MRLFLVGFVLAALAGCDAATEPSAYTDTVLVLVEADLPPGSTVTSLTPSALQFQPSGTLVVDSCNRCEGTYRWNENELVIGGLGCTEIGCGERLDLGTWLVADRIVASDSDDDLVTLVAERGGEIATFVFSVADR